MGRNRSFDESTVVALCSEAFVVNGYEGTSIDDLVAKTGLHRGSLYKAFASKRGLFLAALDQAALGDARSQPRLDLLLVALLELAPRDSEIKLICTRLLAPITDDPAAVLGRRLLERASLTTASTKGTAP